MSVQAIGWVLEKSRARLGPRLVLISIANHADSDGNNSFASVKKLAKLSHLSEREVQYAIKKLIELGELQYMGPNATTRTSIYTISGMQSGAQSLHRGGVQNPAQMGAKSYSYIRMILY